MTGLGRMRRKLRLQEARQEGVLDGIEYALGVAVEPDGYAGSDAEEREQRRLGIERGKAIGKRIREVARNGRRG